MKINLMSTFAALAIEKAVSNGSTWSNGLSLTNAVRLTFFTWVLKKKNHFQSNLI